MKRFEIKDYKNYLKYQLARTDKKSASFIEQPKRLGIFKKSLERVGKNVVGVEKICCMGVKTGYECSEFKKIEPFRNNTVFIDGVELSPIIKKYFKLQNNYIKFYQYDFNKLPDNWIDKYDLIFSNSLDHCFDFVQTIDEWRRVLKQDKYLFLTLSEAKNNYCDIYQFDMNENIDWEKYGFELLMKWAEDKQKTSFNVLLKKK